MFGDEKHDSWKWMPVILLVGALLFLFFDPLGMNPTKVKYFIGLAAAPPNGPLQPVPNPPAGNPPAGNPPAGNPPAPNPPAGNPAPGAAGFPSAADTGPLTAPTQVWPQAGNGTWIVVSQNADGFIFNGCVKTAGPGIRITNSEIRGNCTTSILYDEGGGGIFEHNNIFDVGHQGASTIGCGTASRFFRNNAMGAADGVKEGTNCQIIENYIHNLDEYDTGAGGTHNDGVQIEGGGTTGMLIQKNTFENTCGKATVVGQGCAGVVFINNGAAGNTVDGNYVKRWDGPNAGFIFHTAAGGTNEIKNNFVECANITGFGVTSGGPSNFINNSAC
jgi:hypothetical protein